MTASETLHFACTECGKCCAEAPEMSLIEAIDLGDVFVPALSYKLTRLPKDDNEAGFASIRVHSDFEGMSAREFVACVRESLAVVAGTPLTGEQGWDSFVALTARAWHYPRVGCPALVGKRCSVHERRPATCRTVPVRYDVPDSLLVRAFHATVTRGKAAPDPYECDTSSAAPVFIEGGKLKDEAYAKDRARGQEAAMAEKDLAAKVLTSPYLPPLQEVVDRLRKAGPFSTSFHAVVMHAHELGKLDKAKTLTFARAQRKLLAREVDAAIARKRPDEREWTKRFRALDAAYESIEKSLA